MNNFVKILGANGGKTNNGMHLSSLQVNENVIIDAGNILNGLGDEAININHVFITHSHLDHITDLPFFIDNYFGQRLVPLKIYGTKGTIENIHKHLFNWEIWPDFSKINLVAREVPAIEFIEINIGETIKFDNCSIKSVKNNHTDSSCGYVITKNKNSLLYTSDSYISDSIIDEINSNESIKSVIFDVSFPSEFKQLAYDSKHLTPSLLKDEILRLNRDNINIYTNHLKPSYLYDLKKELDDISHLFNDGKILEAQDIIYL